MAEPNQIHELILKALKDVDNRPMTALNIANKIAVLTNGSVSSLKKQINRVIFNMKEVEKDESKPPQWCIRRDYMPLTSPTPLQTNLSSSNNPTSTNQSQKPPPSYLLGYPTLQPAASLSQSLPDEEMVLDTLRRSEVPLSAVKIAKLVGATSKGDVNPVLYRLKDQGSVLMESSQSDNKPLWRIAAAHISSHEQSLPSMIATGAQDRTGELAHARVDDSTSTQTALYSRTDSLSGEITFKPVGSPEQPGLISSLLRDVEVLEPIAESSPQRNVIQMGIQEGYSPQQVFQPIQVSVDNRMTADSPSRFEPVSSPDPLNFVGTTQSGLASAKPTLAKKSDNKNAISVVNNMNNSGVEADDCQQSPASDDSLPTGATLLDVEETTSSLNSVTLTSTSDSSYSHSSDVNSESTPLVACQGASTNPCGPQSCLVTNSNPPSTTSAKIKSKRSMGIKFPHTQPGNK